MRLYEKIRKPERDHPYRKRDNFEAGRIFERYDKNKDGTMTKKDFVNFFNDINRSSRDFPLLERRGLPSPYAGARRPYRPFERLDRLGGDIYTSPRHRLRSQHRYDDDVLNTRRFRLGTPRMPQNRVNATLLNPLLRDDVTTPRYLTRPYSSDSDHSNVEQRLLHKLDRKIRLLITQSETVKRRMLDIQDACEETERETIDFFQPMIDRVRDEESRMLAGLQRDLDVLNQEADLVNTYAQRVEECEGDYKDLLRLIPTVNEIADRPFKRHFDVQTVRIPREAYDCARALEDIESAEKALKAKDHMIWKLMKERKDDKEQLSITQSESETISERSAQEVAKWKKMSNEFLDKLENCDEELQRKESEVRSQRQQLRRLADMILNEDFEQAKLLAGDVLDRVSTGNSRRVAAVRRRGRRYRNVGNGSVDEGVSIGLDDIIEEGNGGEEDVKKVEESEIAMDREDNTPKSSVGGRENIRMIPSSPEISDLGFELDVGVDASGRSSYRRKPMRRKNR